MRSGVWIIAALWLAATPARAQFGAPFGSPGMFTAPEAAGGVFGAGAASSAATQQQCTQTNVGRAGPKTSCAPQPTDGEERRR